MSAFFIRRVSLEDLEQLRMISIRSFEETFASSNTEENMQQYLETAFTAQKLGEELNSPGSTFYFISTGNELAGYLKVNQGSSQTELKTASAVEIERIYILQKFQGLKLGQALVDKAMELAKQQNASYIWLGVWEKNIRAIQFYEKNGFVAFDKHFFKLGDDEQIDIMMKKTMNYSNI